MSQDIVEWLRTAHHVWAGADPGSACWLRAAADTIAALTAERDTLRQQYADADRDLSAEIARRAEVEGERDRLRKALTRENAQANAAVRLARDVHDALYAAGLVGDEREWHATVLERVESVIAERDRHIHAHAVAHGDTASVNGITHLTDETYAVLKRQSDALAGVMQERDRLAAEVGEAKSLLTALRTWMSSSDGSAYLYHGPAFGPRIDAFLGRRAGEGA